MPTRACAASPWRASAMPSVLADIVRNESEGSVRDHALGQLVEQASKHDAAVAMTAVAALASLGRERELATVAKAAGPDEVRRAAIAAVRDEKALGSIARHAAEAGRAPGGARAPDRRRRDRRRRAARRACRRGGGRDRSPGHSVERDADGDCGEGAHQGRAEKSAHAARRPPSRPAAPAESGPAYKEADQQKARDLVAQMKALSSVADFAQLREAYAAARVAWVELLADADIQVGHRSGFRERIERGSRAPGGGRGGPRRRRASAPRARAGTGRSRRRLRARRGAGRRRHYRRRGRRRARRGKACRRCPRRGPPSSNAVSTKPAAPPKSASSGASSPSNPPSACRRSCPRSKRSPRNPSYNDIRSQWYSLRKQWQAIARDVEIDAELRARYDAAAADARSARTDASRRQGPAAGRKPAAPAGARAEIRDARVRRKPHAQADRSADEGRQAGGRHHGAAAGQTGSRRSDGAPAGGADVVDAAHPGAARSRGVEALGERPGAGRAVRQDGSARAARRNRSGKSVERNAHAAGTVEAGGRGAALAGRDAVDALQDGAGAGLRQVQGLLRATGRRARREPEEEGRALRCAPNRWRIRPTG